METKKDSYHNDYIVERQKQYEFNEKRCNNKKNKFIDWFNKKLKN